MKPAVLLALLFTLLAQPIHAAEESAADAATRSRGLEAAAAITKITGVAISPMLGVGAVGAFEWFTAEKASELSWYARPLVWIPLLLLVTGVAAKDAFGTMLPPGVKKPLDVAETIESKVSGLVAAGAFVPLAATIFKSVAGESAAWGHGLNLLGFAAIDLTPLLNILTIPFAMAAFLVVWLLGHVINVLILLSPFGAVDAALKALRTALMGALALVHAIDPWVGALLSLVMIVIGYLIAGWTMRVMIYGSVFTWDFVTRRHKRFKPADNGNWMFTARKIAKTPIRTYGRLVKAEDKLAFEYRPWLVGAKQSVAVPEGPYAVGRGLFHPEILKIKGEKAKPLFSLPPRYKRHEEEVARVYAIPDVRDTGLLKGIKAFWRWCTELLFGKESEQAAATAVG